MNLLSVETSAYQKNIMEEKNPIRAREEGSGMASISKDSSGAAPVSFDLIMKELVEILADISQIVVGIGGVAIAFYTLVINKILVAKNTL
jgi:hypothetical protein